MKMIFKQWDGRFFHSFVFVIGLMFLELQSVRAQDIQASGRVVDSKDEPMIGVTVKVKGTSVGTITGLDGSFQLKVPPKSMIVFSSIGYQNLEKPAVALKNAIIVMQEDTKVLDEVVVVAYGNQRKETMTGSISQVKTSEILKSPVANMGQALTGRAAGVTTYQASGEPGADDVTIRIRGTGTLNSASPLILVDGVEREFAQIDPTEIESMSILKDAASTAVFGIRGANGVIIITTQKGVEGPAKVSFSANFSLQQPTRMPKSVNAETFARLYNEAQYNDDPTLSPAFSEEDIRLYADGSDPLSHPNVDWKEYMLKKAAFQQKYNLSVSGGTKNVRYYTSVAFFGQDGIMKDFSKKVDGLTYNTNFDYQRINLRSNVDVDLTPTTKLGVQLGGIIAKKNTPSGNAFSQSLQASPIAGPFIIDRKLVRLPTLQVGEGPLATYFEAVEETNDNTINTNLKFDQNLDFILKGLSFRIMASYDSQYAHKITKNQVFEYYDLVDGFDADGNPTKVFQEKKELGLVPNPTDSYVRRQSMHGEAALEYKNTFRGHSIGALFLGTLDKKWWRYNNTDVIKQYVTVPVAYMGVVGRITYDYKSRYLAEFNMGYNGSENFAEGKRFALFPAVSVGWNVAEEPWFQRFVKPSFISRLKLRASYGLTGNDNTDGRRFMYLDGEYKAGTGAIFGSSVQTQLGGFVEGKLGNPNVSWETAAKQNYGIDLGLFHNNLMLTFEYFLEDRKDILATRSTEPGHMAISGQDVYNIGRVKNRGYEIEARWNQSLGKFSYFVSGNYSFARNEIVEDGSIKNPNTPNLWSTGHAVGTPWGYITDGFYNSPEELTGPMLGNPTVGDVRYVDYNKDGRIDPDDRVAIGYPKLPEINYGFSFGASYKGFDFSCLFQGAANSTRVLSGIFQKPFDKKQGIPSFVVDERWTRETAETAKRPKLTLAYTSMSYEKSDLWIRDGSYLKLRNVEIAYTFNKEQLRRAIRFANINSMRFYINGQNLFCWDKLKYIDPEANTDEFFKYPQLRVFNLGLQLNF